MEQYLWQNHVLFKDYLDHVKRVSQKVKAVLTAARTSLSQLNPLPQRGMRIVAPRKEPKNLVGQKGSP